MQRTLQIAGINWEAKTRWLTLLLMYQVARLKSAMLVKTWHMKELMIVIIEFRLACLKKSRIQEYKILSGYKIIFMIYLSCLRNKTYLRNYKEEIEALNMKVTKSHSTLKFKSQSNCCLILWKWCFTYLFLKRGFVENK